MAGDAVPNKIWQTYKRDLFWITTSLIVYKHVVTTLYCLASNSIDQLGRRDIDFVAAEFTRLYDHLELVDYRI